MTKPEEGSAGGTFNDINAPQQMTQRFDVIPEQYS